MRGVALLVVACACDQVFAIQRTHTHDAPFFDAMLDAPFACPMLGTTPMYSPYVHLVSSDDCFEYTPSFTSGRVVASLCNDAAYPIYEGPIDGPLKGAIPAGLQYTELKYPRLTPDGSTMYVRLDDLSAQTSTFVAYTRASDGTWQPAPAPSFPTDAIPSNVVRAPTDDRVLLAATTMTELDEWSDAGGMWHQVTVHPVAELGLTYVSTVRLSSDGLRMIAVGGAALGDNVALYSDRTRVDAPFRAADKLTGVPPNEPDAIISDDCARVYLSGLGALFYVRQL